jgi:hypothetical protein
VVAAPGDEALGQRVAAEITELCKGFPAPGILLLRPGPTKFAEQGG